MAASIFYKVLPALWLIIMADYANAFEPGFSPPSFHPNSGFPHFSMGNEHSSTAQQPSAVAPQPSSVESQHSSVGHQSSFVGQQPSSVAHQPSFSGHQPSFSGHQHSSMGFQHSSFGHQHSSSATQVSHKASGSAHPSASASTGAGLDPAATNCQLALPSNALTPEGLSTPWELLPPCSQAVDTQQAFAEAAVIDSNGQISIYHPLIIDQGKTPQAAPVVPNLGGGSQVALFFGFNGDVLTLVDTSGQDTNASPVLSNLNCVNGLPGVQGDVFGQVSWCNTQPFWNAANSAVANGQLQVPPLGNDGIGKQCPSVHSFEIVDQDQSDNLPTKYLLLDDGSTVQFTAANQAKFGTATEIDNASDEALIADFIAPAIGCTPFMVDSIDDPGTQVSSLATQELQALVYQQEPIAIVPLNDPDCLLTSSGAQSPDKTNAYRMGVNQPQLGTGSNTDEGSGTDYCNNLIKIQVPFLASFQNQFAATETPDAGIGNNLFTFLGNRFLQSLTNLNCPNQNIPLQCTLDGNGAATACSFTNGGGTGSFSATAAPTFSHSVHPFAFGNYTATAGFKRAATARQATITARQPRATPWFA